jgi:hypothetical protein
MRKSMLWCAALLALALVVGAVPAKAQVQGLYYQEVAKDGRVYVFNTPEKYKAWQSSGDMGVAVTLVGRGANGETVVGENDTAIDLYLFRHNLPAYERPTPKPAAPAAYPKTTVGGRVYADFSDKENKDKGKDVKTTDSGSGIDIKRFYATITHDFDAVWSAQFQSDIGDQGTKRYDVFVKKAYIQAKISPSAIFRVGSADMAWIPFVESAYGMRYLEQTVTDHLSFGTSADWGVHFLGKAVDDKVGYQISLVNGKGYSNPTRTKSMDLEGRLSFEPVKGLLFAVGGYSGKLGNDTEPQPPATSSPAKHTASRTDFLAQYSNAQFKIGGEYFTADNWKTVASTTTDKADGVSLWAQFNVSTETMLFARYDDVKPSKDLNSALKDTYYNLGVQYRFNKSFAGSLAWKYAEVKGGTLSTGNGTIGSTVPGAKGEYNEIGLFGVYDF